MRMHVLQHVPFETPGMILDWAKVHEHEVTFTRFYEPSPALPCIDAYDFLVIMGGPMSVNEDTTHSWLIAEKTHIRQAIEARKKLLGICLGAQVIAASLGAWVYSNHVKEVGWFPVAIVDAALSHPIVSEVNHAMTVFHWHGETFDLPQGAVLLMSSAACVNQAFIYNQRVVGLQFHLEMDEPNICELITHCRSELVDAPTIQSADHMLGAQQSIAACKRALYIFLDFLAAQ